MIMVTCVLVRGNVPFTPEYVVRLRSMIGRFIDRSFHMFCLTDQPKSMPRDVTPIVIKPRAGMPGWWSKLELFNPANGLKGPGLYVDLDVLLVAPLRPIIEFPAGMALAPHAGSWEGRDGKVVVKRFNSSVIKVDDWCLHHHLYSDWSPAVADRLWGDQDWIGERAPYAQTMPLEWFPRLSEVKPPWPRGTKVVLCKKPKNHDAVKQYPWFNEMWR